MDRGKRAALAAVAATLTVVGWLMMMASFWTPTEFAQTAMLHTSLALLSPGVVGSVLTWSFWDEMLATRPVPQLRCTECAARILNPSGATSLELSKIDT